MVDLLRSRPRQAPPRSPALASQSAPSSNDGVAEAPPPPARSHDALKARATRWLVAAFLAAVAIGQAIGWVAGAKSPQVLRLCLFVPFLILGTTMIAIDVRLRFAAARYFINPHWTYLLL